MCVMADGQERPELEKNLRDIDGEFSLGETNFSKVA